MRRSPTTPEDEGEGRVLDGVRTTRDQLLATLAREGFQAIESDGAPFDPAVHDAVAGPSDGSDEPRWSSRCCGPATDSVIG